MKGTLIAVGISGLVGLGTGFSLAVSGVQQNAAGSDTPPPPKIVKVPQTVVERVPGPTKYEVQPIPDSCLKAVRLSFGTYHHVKDLDQVSSRLSSFTTNSLVPHALGGNVPALNRDRIVAQRLSDRINTIVYGYLDGQQEARFNLQDCVESMKAANSSGD